jgi:ribosomal protein S18 acetylase RimI-like enzyme
MTTIRLVVQPHAPESDRQVVRESLDLYNVARTGHDDYHPVSIFLRGRHDEIRGGLLGNIWGGWLHVTFLWVAEPLRGSGWGTRLLRAAERLATESGCRGVWLSSFDFQAPGFYRRLGYREFGVLEDQPIGHSHHFLAKRLRPARRPVARRRRPRR